MAHLKDSPHVLGCMTELTACNAGTEIEVADGDTVVFDGISEVITTLCHGADEYGNALVFAKSGNVVADTYDLGVETQRDLAAIWWQVIGDWVFDDFEKLFLRRGRANLVSVQQLYHQARKALERSRKAHSRTDADEDVL